MPYAIAHRCVRPPPSQVPPSDGGVHPLDERPRPGLGQRTRLFTTLFTTLAYDSSQRVVGRGGEFVMGTHSVFCVFLLEIKILLISPSHRQEVRMIVLQGCTPFSRVFFQ